MRIELLAPSRARVGEQDVDMVGVLAHLGHQPLNLGHLTAVRGHGDGDGARALVGERVQRFAGLLARLGFPRGDEDFGAAGLEESGLRGVLLAILPSFVRGYGAIETWI